MVQLGQFFYNEGDDSEKAFYWLQHAAGKGDITAQATIGVMYKTGEGVKEQSIEKVSKKTCFITDTPKLYTLSSTLCT